MSSAESMTLEDCIATFGEILIKELLTPVELRTADGQSMTILSGDVNPAYPESIRVTVDGVEYEIMDEVVEYIKAKLVERQA